MRLKPEIPFFVFCVYHPRFPKLEGEFRWHRRPPEAIPACGMELWGRADPQLREVVWFSLRCRALALLLQASLSSGHRGSAGLCCSQAPPFSTPEVRELVLHDGEIIFSREPIGCLHPWVLLTGCC